MLCGWSLRNLFHAYVPLAVLVGFSSRFIRRDDRGAELAKIGGPRLRQRVGVLNVSEDDDEGLPAQNIPEGILAYSSDRIRSDFLLVSGWNDSGEAVGRRIELDLFCLLLTDRNTSISADLYAW